MTAEEIIQELAGQGLRITDQRRTLAKLFAETEGYLMAKDVYEVMGKQYSGLSFDTVYRNLRLMHDLGVLEQFVFEDGVKFRVHCADFMHHHHLICLHCDKTFPISYCPMIDAAELPTQFEVVKHKFEIYGYCKDCQETLHS